MIYLRKLLLLLLVTKASTAQIKTVSGYVTDHLSNPVNSHWVEVYVDSAGISGSYSKQYAQTNTNGYYTLNVPVTQPNGTLIATTYNCHGTALFDTITYTNAGTYTSVNFTYCDTTSQLSGYIEADTLQVPYTLMATSLNQWGNCSFEWNTGDTGQVISIHQTGSYCVTITDHSNTSFSTCKNITVNCKAYFEYQRTGNSVDFTAQVYGASPVNYAWNFDDGNSSSANHPTHSFQTDYVDAKNVCLTINDNNNCMSTYCRPVVVGPNGGNHRIAGNAFGGAFPLNRMHFYLYAVQSDHHHNTLTLLDSVYSGSSTNSYAFEDLPTGEYTIRAEVDPSHVQAYEYVPTYLGGHVQWGNALSVLLQNNLTGNNINIKRHTPTNGQGMVSGTIVDSASQQGVENVRFYLLDSLTNVVAFDVSDATGDYELLNILPGLYQVWVDLPGKESIPQQVVVSADNLTVVDVNWEEREFSVAPPNPDVSVDQLNQQTQIVLYPNPVDNQLYITTNRPVNRLRIFDQQGRIVYDQTQPPVTIDATSLASGVYFVELTGDQFFETRKIVKK